MENKKKAIIGVIGVPEHNDEGDPLIGLYKDYKNAIITSGGFPFMIPPLLDIDYYSTRLRDVPELTEDEKKTYREMIDMCDGIIMQGGYRIYNYCEYILNYAIEKDIPVLGVCMGMQLLAKIDNGDYCLEENDTDINHRQPRVDYVHNVNILEGTMLKDIVKEEEIKVNSKHRFHVKGVNNFRISAYSEDGLIEGIELPGKKFVIGVQWHPEKMINYDPAAHRLFARFIEECQK